MRVSECGRKIRNANRMPKSDGTCEEGGGREGRWEEDKEEERGGGGERGGGERGGGGGERVTRAYTVEVQTASVFYTQSLILLSLMAVKYGHTR